MKKQVVVFWLVLMLVNIAGTGRCSAKSFGDCFSSCNDLCLVKFSKAADLLCATKCAAECVFSNSMASASSTMGLNQADSTRSYFCKLGCVTSRCAKLSTKENPGMIMLKFCFHSNIFLNKYSLFRSTMLRLIDNDSKGRVRKRSCSGPRNSF